MDLELREGPQKSSVQVSMGPEVPQRVHAYLLHGVGASKAEVFRPRTHSASTLHMWAQCLHLLDKNDDAGWSLGSHSMTSCTQSLLHKL